ncbi:NAD(P)H-hydrate dehydratase [Kitasatospora sp. NPDC004289]
MRSAHTVGQVRAAEAELMARLPEGTLMQRAAYGLAAVCARLLGRVYGARVLVLAGSGDNGGDALYAGALLARRGASVRALLLSPERVHAGGLAALRAAGGVVTADQGEYAGADLVLDGIVGIGGRGGLRPEASWAATAERRGTLVAVDVPSGVDADTGEVPGAALRADVTVCFGTYKPGLLIDPGASYAGVVHLVEIGLDLPQARVTALQEADVAALLPVPGTESDKYRRGVVGVAAGSEQYPGAAVLAVAGALRGGAGAVRYAGSAAAEVVRRFPEVLVSEGTLAAAGRVQAWVVGPGGGAGAGERLDQALAGTVPVVVDADGLTELARRGPQDGPPLVLTPHTGEAARLLAAGGEPPAAADLAATRLRTARRLAERYGAVVLLKGSTTVVATPDGRARVNPTGTSWLATAGSGDVLAGLLGSLMAAGLSPFDAASVAAYRHGLAGRRAAAQGTPITATEVAGELVIRPGARGSADVRLRRGARFGGTDL